MKSRTLKEVAEMLAKAHRHADPKTSVVRFFPKARADHVCLLEVSEAAPTIGEIMPFRFAADVANGVEYPSIVVLVSPDDWQAVISEQLGLPDGWDLRTAENL